MSTTIEARPAPTKGLDPSTITRPDQSLLRYYGIISILTGPAFPFVFLPLYCKYVTLKYRFDDRGVSMSWGVLFRREIYLTYRRIQDIHLTRNLIQRWMGLATIGVQTASGSSGPEMTIEGILEADALRDYLYSQMRGARGLDDDTQASSNEEAPPSVEEPLELLRDIRDLLKTMVQRREANQ